MTTITLPSGLTGSIRGLTGADGRYLTNEALVRDNEVEDFILDNCWTSTDDFGPYAFKTKPEWPATLVGDRTVAMLRIRHETYPDKPYTLKLKCPVKVCRKPIDWDVDIEKFVKERIQMLSLEARETFKNGNQFSVTIPVAKGAVAKKLLYRLQTSASRKQFLKWREQQAGAGKKAQERQNDLVNSLLFWRSEIEGIEKKDLIARQDFLEALPLGAIVELKHAIERNDCGVDTEIPIECPKCGYEWTVELPFNREFFVPSDKTKKATAKDEADAKEAEASASDES